MSHPAPHELAAHLDGPSAPEVAAHLTSCAPCARVYGHLAALRSALAAPGAPDPRVAAAVMARLDARGAGPGRGRLALVGGLVGALVGALATVLIVASSRPDEGAGDFTARGGEGEPPVVVTSYLHAAAGGARVPLGAGAGEVSVEPGFGLSFRVLRRGPEPTWLMLFGCDARGELHWAVPAWDDAAADPSGLALDPAAPLVDLPSGLMPDAPAGPFMIVSLTTPTPARVRAVEAHAGACPDLVRALRTWPGARVQTTTLRIAEPR